AEVFMCKRGPEMTHAGPTREEAIDAFEAVSANLWVFSRHTRGVLSARASCPRHHRRSAFVGHPVCADPGDPGPCGPAACPKLLDNDPIELTARLKPGRRMPRGRCRWPPAAITDASQNWPDTRAWLNSRRSQGTGPPSTARLATPSDLRPDATDRRHRA